MCFIFQIVFRKIFFLAKQIVSFLLIGLLLLLPHLLPPFPVPPSARPHSHTVLKALKSKRVGQ